MEAGAGVDTEIHADSWKDTRIITEIICLDFAEAREKKRQQSERIATWSIPQMTSQTEQLALL